MADLVTVETSDHARLNIKLSYNWFFEVDPHDPVQADKLFSVRDFVGDCAKALASRVRGAVAGQKFDDFHKHSAEVIKQAVFGRDNDRDRLIFTANNLVITNVDIQSVEPVDARTREALQKSVQSAIEIATASQQALANHEARREEEIAKGRLEQQKIKDLAAAERKKKELVQLQADTAAVEQTGQAKAEAQAHAETARIKGEAAVRQAEMKAQATAIRCEAELKQLVARQRQELAHKKALDELEIDRAQKEAEIEANKFKQIIDAIGADTIEAIAMAGPEMQAKLLEGLGLQGYLVTDGNSPINLFNTAFGLVGQPRPAIPAPAASVGAAAGAGLITPVEEKQ
jgi:major vault protein